MDILRIQIIGMQIELIQKKILVAAQNFKKRTSNSL